MKIDIKHDEGTSGFFSKKAFTVTFDVQFSEEERAQIEELGITRHHDTNAIVTGLQGTLKCVFLDHLMKGPRTYSGDSLDYATDLEDRTVAALKSLKERITSATDPATKSKTIEL